MNTYKSNAHSIGEANWHLQFTPAYRRPIFRDPIVRELTIAYLFEAAAELGVHIGAMECGPDHIHLFVQETRKVSIIAAVQKLKGYTSKKMREAHQPLLREWLWGEKFWSAGYFYQTVGTITAASVKEYILKGQEKHWKGSHDIRQKTLFNYTA
ncbi:MAG: putative transposase [Stygiobacter sp.]|nr:MAG: putative transposase [Stygiobacter sp.]